MEFLPNADDLPFLTEEVPGVGGVIKRYDEDFLVEEIPLYEPGGTGTHTYFTIQKSGLTTLAAIRHVARALGVKRQDVGYAGLKDAHGVTRQRLSIEHVAQEKIRKLDLPRIRVLSIDLHSNKLKLGHLAGNRFVIRIRDAEAGTRSRAESVIAILEQRGVPNYFGPQRFGVRGDNAAVGRAVIVGDLPEALAIMLGRPNDRDTEPVRIARECFDRGDWKAAAKAWPERIQGPARICEAMAKSGGDPVAGWRAVDHALRKLYVSSVQSALFNSVLAARMQGRETEFDVLLDGDVAWKHRNGACFAVEDAVTEQPRCRDFEVSPSGPLFGRKMKSTTGIPGRMEQEMLRLANLSTAAIVGIKSAKFEGARRPLRVPLHSPCVKQSSDERGRYLEVSFELPAGSYATNVTREIQK